MINSIIRTIVPVVAGQLLGWLAVIGIVDASGELESSLVSLVTIIITGAYYGLVRLLESKVSPKFGWLLGLATEPEYKQER